MPRKPVWTQDDVTAILTALFDIHRELTRIRKAVEEDDESEEEEN